jgi:trans-aconitate methyltransferase
MKPKQFSTSYASIFQDVSVVSAYEHRPTYPAETFRVLVSLIPPELSSRVVLDAGCGTGFIARPLAAMVEQVDAVDISEGMIAKAKTQPGGDRPNIRWIAAPIETAPFAGLYGLIVAAASLHWMDWELTLPRFARHLVPGGMLALVEEVHTPNPWDQPMGAIITRYSMNKDYAPYSLETIASELEGRGLFERQNRYKTAAVPFQQTIDAYVASFHARNGLSLDRMEAQAAAQCDAELRAAVAPFCPGGVVEQKISARILAGRPLHRKETGS